MVKCFITVSIGHAAARIISINQIEIVCGRFEQLEASTKFENRSTHCDVSLRFYGSSAPEGSLAKIKIPHPSYPSTRISVQVPKLGIHFLPSRYRRLMELLNIIYGTMETSNLPEIIFKMSLLHCVLWMLLQMLIS